MQTCLPKALAVGINGTLGADGSICQEFNQLCVRHGSDKGWNHDSTKQDWPFAWPPHSYGGVYGLIIDELRQDSQVKAVFECGIGTTNPNIPSNMGKGGKPGASLYMWRELFPHAHILGADVDASVLLDEERISSYYVDQLSSESIDAMWGEISTKLGSEQGIALDLMIDDGLHTFDANTTLLESSWRYLRVGGYYVIEDIGSENKNRLVGYLGEKKLTTKWAAITLERPLDQEGRCDDDTLIVLQKVESS